MEINASDVHLSVGLPWKYRINGNIAVIQKLLPLKSNDCTAILKHILLQSKTVAEDRVDDSFLSVFDLNDQKSIRLRLAESLKAVISQQLLRRKDNSVRVAIVEAMQNTLSIKDCIENPEKGGSIRDFIASGTDQYGMQTFDQHLMDLYNNKVISLDIAKSAATSSADFRRTVQFAG